MAAATTVLIPRKTAQGSKRFRLTSGHALLVLTGTTAPGDGAQLLRWDAEANVYLPILDCDGDARGITTANPLGTIVSSGDYEVVKKASAGLVGVQLQMSGGLGSVITM